MSTKLLIVDDDVTLGKFLGEYLQTEGFTIVTAHNGADALRLAYREHPDLVILDVMMPGMDGWEVTARLREMADIPIILVTGKSTEADKLRGFRLGVDDYVVKPFSFAELSARVQAVLGRLRASSAPQRDLLQCGNMVIDVDKRQVHCGNEIVPLTPTEFRLLEVLARHFGHAVPEMDLAQEVWGNYRGEDDATLRRFIWLLRQKIETDPANPRLILTVRGYGYRLGTGTGQLRMRDEG
jgi:DNA-binding response OmpR family regulator